MKYIKYQIGFLLLFVLTLSVKPLLMTMTRMPAPASWWEEKRQLTAA